jgi:hypothetical protein
MNGPDLSCQAETLLELIPTVNSRQKPAEHYLRRYCAG